MVDEIKTLREAAHVIEGIKSRLTIMTAVFAVSAGLGASIGVATFWQLDAKIDKISNDLFAIRADTKHLTEINSALIKLSKLSFENEDAKDAETFSLPTQKKPPLLASQAPPLAAAAPKPDFLRVSPVEINDIDQITIPSVNPDILSRIFKIAPPPDNDRFFLISTDLAPDFSSESGNSLLFGKYFRVNGEELRRLPDFLRKSSPKNNIGATIIAGSDKQYLADLRKAVVFVVRHPR